MKQQNKKKPTMKEMEKVVGSLIVESQNLRAELMVTQQVLNNYIEFKDDVKEFTKHVEVKKDGRKNKRDSKIVIAKK